MTLTLPFPPSVNTYWRRVGSCTVLSVKAREYRGAAIAACALQRAPKLGAARVSVEIVLHAPDRRQYDLDNRSKGLLDALVHAGVLNDDSQVDDLRLVRGQTGKPGRAVVTIEALP